MTQRRAEPLSQISLTPTDHMIRVLTSNTTHPTLFGYICWEEGLQRGTERERARERDKLIYYGHGIENKKNSPTECNTHTEHF